MEIVQPKQNRSLTFIVNSSIGTLALLMFISGMYPSSLNWGIHQLAFFPISIRFTVPLLMLLLISKKIEII